MDKIVLLLLIVGACMANLAAQKGSDRPQMQPKVYNFYTFTPDIKMDISKEPALFPDSLRNHPEFGILPYNTQCENCYEEIGKRTAYSRYFVEPGTEGSHYYVQQSFYPLHYQTEEGYWVTLDHRMKVQSGYAYGTSAYGGLKTLYHEGMNYTRIANDSTGLDFNKALSAYYTLSNGAISSLGSLQEANKSLGSDGVLIVDAWKDINIQHIFKRGGIKTNFVLMQKPTVPANGEYLVFEQLLACKPGNLEISYSPQNGYFNTDSLFVGNIEARDKNGNLKFVINEATFYDGYGYGTKGGYKLSFMPPHPIHGGAYHATYTLQLYVPVSFLNDPNVTYPLYIDPFVTPGFDSLGRFSFQDPQANFSANMAFTTNTVAPGYCPYTLAVTVPGMSEIVNTKIDIEYENTFSATCGTPPLQPPFCQFQDVRMEVRSVECGTTTGPLTCNPAAPPFIGTCTTDPNLVPGASALNYPGFLSCIPPQCPDYVLNFELRNSEIQCGENCGYNCAKGHYWAITIEARTIENTIALSRDTVCAGDTVTLTAFPDWGVPPYRYEWTPGGQTDSIIVFSSDVSTFISCTAYDFCNNPADVVDILLTTRPSPDANAGDTLRFCEGGSGTLGGSPTTSTVLATFNWTAEPPAAISYLNAVGSSNPIVTVPQGVVDTLMYVVRVDDPIGCFRRDTVWVLSGENPVPVVVPDTAYICPGEATTFNTTEPFSAYNWSDGSTDAVLSTSDLGSFDVTVTDGNGCTGTSNTVITLLPNLPAFSVFAIPDSVFNLGESAMLGATIDLTTTPIDSFFWGPGVGISCLDCPDPIVSPEEDQLYILEVYSQGCRLLDSIYIDIKFPNAYWIPRAFTPNNDGLNDRFFVIKESGVTVKDFKIFNRWGQLIYNNVFPWDGVSKGQPVDMGVYSFIFTLQLSDGSEVVESGQVTVIR